ncbi:MAG: phosphatidate cytidylyltransferase [Tissierellia bacterium]|nr:phosphatidate cytidylyltransferase [Tissierellia bacterium]
MKSLIIRSISGLTLVILTIFAIKLGNIYLYGYVFLLSIIGISEFYDAVKNINIKPIKLIGYIACVIFLLNSIGILWAKVSYIFIFVSILLLVCYFTNKKVKFSDVIATFFSIFYIPFLLQHIIYLSNGIYIWLVFIIAWGTDTFAYVFGMLFGKHKLCPSLSPKKTIEGSIGGIIGAIGLTYLYIKYLEIDAYWAFLLIAFIGSIVAQIGDLTASKIKRVTGIKDFGFIMPGHGGVLDRFDSILFIAPYTYYISKLFL